MAVQLTIDEMLEVLRHYCHPEAGAYAQRAEALADMLADHVATLLDADRAGDASSEEIAFGGTCAPFLPRHATQPVPDALTSMDVEVQEWIDQAAEIGGDA